MVGTPSKLLSKATYRIVNTLFNRLLQGRFEVSGIPSDLPLGYLHDFQPLFKRLLGGRFPASDTPSELLLGLLT